MDLTDKKVIHSKFGIGKIVVQEAAKITVEFSEETGRKIFQYPGAFGDFLQLEDKSQNKEVEAILNRKKEALQFVQTKNQLLSRNKQIKEAAKYSKHFHDNNIAIKYVFCDGGSSENVIGYKGVCSDEMINKNVVEKKVDGCCQEASLCQKYSNKEITREELEDAYMEREFPCVESKLLTSWRAYLGLVKSGTRKGKPIVIREITSNGLVLLTTNLPGTKEQDRIIFGVFLLLDQGKHNDGKGYFINADFAYKIPLNLEEAKQLKFWDYFYNEKKPEAIRMGSGLNRHITDIQGIQVLKKIIELKTTEKEIAYANGFLDYFCSVKEIDIDSVPEACGSLKRQ